VPESRRLPPIRLTHADVQPRGLIRGGWSIFFLGLQLASGVLKTPSYRGTKQSQCGAGYQGLSKQSKIHVALLVSFI